MPISSRCKGLESQAYQPLHRREPAALKGLLTLVAILGNACVGPVHHAKSFAHAAGFYRHTKIGTGFRHVIYQNRATTVELFGHSGGATLAVLLAQRVDNVSRVVTIGANLDLAAWCRLHRYSPLSGSVSPVDLPPHRVNLSIRHLVGENDTNTPPVLVQTAAHIRGDRRDRAHRFSCATPC